MIKIDEIKTIAFNNFLKLLGKHEFYIWLEKNYWNDEK